MKTPTGKGWQAMDKCKKVAIIGAGGFAREVLDIFDACNEAGDRYDVLGYIVEPGFGAPGVIVNGKPILGGIEWLGKQRGEVYAICAIGAPEVRRRLVVEAKKCRCSLLQHYPSDRSNVVMEFHRKRCDHRGRMHPDQPDPDWQSRPVESRLHSRTRCNDR